MHRVAIGLQSNLHSNGTVAAWMRNRIAIAMHRLALGRYRIEYNCMGSLSNCIEPLEIESQSTVNDTVSNCIRIAMEPHGLAIDLECVCIDLQSDCNRVASYELQLTCIEVQSVAVELY